MGASSYVVYEIYSLSEDKRYIGISSDFLQRWMSHILALQNRKHHSQSLQDVYNVYGISDLTFRILEMDVSEADVEEREIYWIEFYDAYEDGFNQTTGGIGGNTIPCEWNDIQYESITEAAEAVGVSIVTMYKYVREGWICDADIRYGKGRGKVCTWNGKTYESIREASAATGINYQTLREYISKGFKGDDDIPGKIGSPCMWEGKKYRSIKAAAEDYGCNPKTMRKYLSDEADDRGCFL